MAIQLLDKIQSMDDNVKHQFSGKLATHSPIIDQLLKWLPVASALVSNGEKTDTKNMLAKRLKTVALSETILNALLLPLKKITARRRPDAYFQHDSFPSGHTATSFMGAEILSQAASDKTPAIRYAGYAIATATAAMRVYEKKHWLSDVIAGAVLGIAAAKLAGWIVDRQTAKMNIATS